MDFGDDEVACPPIGRMETGLRLLQLQIGHTMGTLSLDAMTAQKAAVREELRLGGTLGPSSLSGQPGYLIRTSEVQLLLTREELYRFVRRELQPTEVRKLRKRFGAFFEIDDAFYDEDTCVALQPSPRGESKPARLQPAY